MLLRNGMGLLSKDRYTSPGSMSIEHFRCLVEISSIATKLMDGSNTLHYQAWVQKGQKAVEEGDFTAVANFNLTYN